ncbi:hypothetical protein F5884DRAFT_850699 [Xylogone sp. PMI_703]|nr:hypothetical protein F5884DRAFT_850699 [Xylogone sp. PMI_703]
MFELAKSVGGLEDRLINIERTLICLKHTLQTAENLAKVEDDSESCRASDMERIDSQLSTFQTEPRIENVHPQSRDRYIIRSLEDLSDRYYGPCSLVGLCNEFRDSILKYGEESNKENSKARDHEELRLTEVQSLLTEMCSSAGVEEPFDLENDNMPIYLPPKQFLVMACTSFFQQEDPELDLFCEASFWRKVEEIYSKPLSPSDHVWALCFNNILLLVLGAEQLQIKGNGEHGLESQFALPFISTICCALACPKTLMRPKLINLQALVLLGHVAQKYLPPSFTEVLLAQACLLAKRMGLHQQCVTMESISPEEEEERIKVFRLLYLKDKSLSLSLGMTSWLPSFDCDMSCFTNVFLGGMDPALRIELALLQETIYRVVYSPESHRLSASQRKISLLGIEKSLNHWLEVFAESGLSLHSLPVDIQLSFYFTRVIALYTSSDLKHRQQLVRDSRIICQLTVASNSSEELDAGHTECSGANGVLKRPSTIQHKLVSAAMRQQPKFRIRTVMEDFPIPAFFVLLKNIIWPILDDSQVDLQLLQSVSRLFEGHDHKTQANNNTRRVSKTFRSLLAITQVLCPELYIQQYEPALAGDHNIQEQNKHHRNPNKRMTHPAPYNIRASAETHNMPVPFIQPPFPYPSVNTTNHLPNFEQMHPIDLGTCYSQFDLPQEPYDSYLNDHQKLQFVPVSSLNDNLSYDVSSYFPDMDSIV